MSVVVAESDVFNFSLDIVWDVFQGPFKDTEVGATFHFHGADRVLSELSETDHVVAYTTGPRTDRYALRGVTEDDTTVVEVSVTFDEGTDASVVDECKAGLPGKLLHIGQMVKRTYWTAARVRDTFVNFFVEKKDHKNIKSSSVVPHSDPTLLFANAGMNQFKPIFLGQVVPGSWMDGLRRASNTQKCIRAGGKHNDLEDVGKDVYHHTFFEMLGNWSFGDYFKKEAIAWAWELLTKVYRLDPTRLYATYFGGDEAMGLPADDEAREIWLQFLPESHILPFDKKDNFWEMGATGPCGPCTELHFDRIGNRECPELVNMDDPDVLEIWNLVFIQFNRLPDQSLDPLPAQSIDTGMGFERITSVLQDLRSNYDSDIFTRILRAIEELRGEGVPTYQGRVGADDVGNVDMAYRVLADHVRTLTFAITDGAVPGNNGRNYVLRRILRRAVRYGQQILKCKPGFFVKLVPVVNEVFGHAFPELGPRVKYVEEIIEDEEETFGRTLSRGVKLFNRHLADLKEAGAKEFPGKIAFQLYDTYGFPYDLTELMAEEEGLTTDAAGYEAAMSEQQERGRNARVEEGFDLALQQEQTLFLSTSDVPVTDDEPKYDWYKVHDSALRAIFVPGEGGRVDHVDEVTAGETVIGVVMNSTPFYAEAGGQVFDTGFIVSGLSVDAKESTDHELDQAVEEAAVRFAVQKVVKFAGYVLHVGRLEVGSLSVGTEVSAVVDYERRALVAPNHTMTHMLNFALRKVLGQECDQKGSDNDTKRARFDFEYPKALTDAEIQAVEDEVNSCIERGLKVHTMSVPYAQAKTLTTTLRCAFDETYPPIVRVISIGHELPPMLEDPTSEKWAGYSVELCGGTHLANTAKARRFALIEEGSIRKGVRRVVAVTGQNALDAFENAAIAQSLIDEAQGLKDNADVKAALAKAKQAIIDLTLPLTAKRSMSALVDRLEQERFAAAKQAAQAELEGAVALAAASSETKRIIISADVGGDKALVKQLKQLAKQHACSVFLVSTDKDNIVCFCAVQKAHIADGFSAVAWVKHVAAALNAKAGGKPDFAQAKFKGMAGNPAPVLDAANAFLSQ